MDNNDLNRTTFGGTDNTPDFVCDDTGYTPFSDSSNDTGNNSYRVNYDLTPKKKKSDKGGKKIALAVCTVVLSALVGAGGCFAARQFLLRQGHLKYCNLQPLRYKA